MAVASYDVWLVVQSSSIKFHPMIWIYFPRKSGFSKGLVPEFPSLKMFHVILVTVD